MVQCTAFGVGERSRLDLRSEDDLWLAVTRERMLLYIKINGIPWVVVRSAEIAAPEVAAALPDLTLVSDVEIKPDVEVMSVSDSIVTGELWSWLPHAK